MSLFIWIYTVCIFKHLIWSVQLKGLIVLALDNYFGSQQKRQLYTSRKHAYMNLTPLNPTFI